MTRVEVVRLPYLMPAPPDVPFAIVDVAFAGAETVTKTYDFIEAAGERLRAWVDHHEHPEGWPRFRSDPRFTLVSSRFAHACPELVTRDVVRAAGPVGAVLAHHDFDGLMSAACWLREGEPPYSEALEDARATDSPGRGHVLSARGARWADALSEAGAELEEEAYFSFFRALVDVLVTGSEPPSFTRELDRFAAEARRTEEKARLLAETRAVEAPGVCVLRLPAQLDRRMRRAILSILEGDATVGLVLEGTEKRYWATAATYFDDVHLDRVTELDRGRHDFRFGPTKNAAALVQQLSALAREAGRG